MKNNRPRKYEKASEHVIRVIIEKAQEVDLTTLLKNRKVVKDDIDTLNQRLADIDEVLAQAKVLGITEEEKDVNPQKPKK